MQVNINAMLENRVAYHKGELNRLQDLYDNGQIGIKTYTSLVNGHLNKISMLESVITND